MLLTIPYPQINPVLVQIGPLAIRWYALAYIAGLIAGLGLCRAIWWAATRLWGGPPPPDAADIDDLRRLDRPRHHSRRPHRLCTVLQSAALSRPSGADLALWEGGMSFHGGLLGAASRIVCFARRMKVPVLSVMRYFRRCRADRALPRPHRQFHQTEIWGRPTDVPWAMIFPGSDGIRGIRASFMRRASKAWCCYLLWRWRALGALRRPGLSTGASRRLRRRAHHLSNFSASPMRSSAFCGGG